MLETPTAQPLLRLDPELGQLLSPERLQAAGRQLRVRVSSVDPGPWRPDRLMAATNAANVGLLVLDGCIARELRLQNERSAELYGAGDIIRTWQADAAPQMLGATVAWSALDRASVALLDRVCALEMRRYPEVMTVVLDRLNARAERLAMTQAISQMTGVDIRVEALLWHLAERWGRVGRDGVIVSLALSHRMIGSLVGARRPTVSTALARLAEEHRVARRGDGTWLLTGSPPLAASSVEESPIMDAGTFGVALAGSLGI
jgi:hypothetical protein